VTKIILVLLIFVAPNKPPMTATSIMPSLDMCTKAAGEFLAQGPQVFDAVAIAAVCEVQTVGVPS
jgi:hypothetical protein